MGISRLFGLCAAVLFASSVSAAVTIDLGPSNYRNFGPNATHAGPGIRSSFGQTVRLPPAGTSLSVTRNAVIPYGSIANGAKSFLRINPASAAASAALTAMFLGLDWLFDPETDQWMKEGESSLEYVDPLSGGYTNSDASGELYPTAESACAATTSCMSFGPCSVGPLFTARQGTCINPDGYSRSTWSIVDPVCPSGSVRTDYGCAITIDGEYEDLTDSDWLELENTLPSLPPSEVAQAASDIQRRQGAPLPGYSDATITGPASVSGPSTTSTSTDPVTGDTIITTTNTTTNISYGDTTITTTDTTTTTTYQNGQQTNTTTITETPGELPVTDGGGAPSAGEWPGFCEWASIVCEWIGWTREEPPAEPDLPQVIDDDFYEEKEIRFGAKTCPPDYEISIPFINSTAAVPMQPLCDFAGIIYYMVMAAAYIIAAYITIGVARNG
ncbi:MAG: virulence factor TspB C-terminal domain-related protein [Candidatus Methanomethylicaceae archaeon]